MYPLVDMFKKLWKITIFNGQINDFHWAIFSATCFDLADLSEGAKL